MTRDFNVNLIIETLQSVLSANAGPVALHEPYFGGREWEYVKDCLDSGWVSSAGAYVNLFEELLARYTGVNHAVAVVNGTAALHVSLMVLGITAGDEVLVPTLTFVATANSVAYCGAIPHFVDSEARTLGIDPYKLKDYLNELAELRSGECFNRITGRRIKAIVSMHTFGHPVDIDPLVEICHRFKLELIEDAAESLGSLYKGRHTGSWGRLSIFSFNGNKIITTGGGGAIVTGDEKLAQFIRHLTTQAKLSHQWNFDHDVIGFNYRMPNINAALGCAQLENLPKFIESKRELAFRYQQAFAGVEGVTVFQEPDFARSNYWLNVLLLDKKNVGFRDQLLEMTNRTGIMTRPAWTLMHKLPMYRNCPRMDLSGAEELEQRIINLPSSVLLDKRYLENAK